MAGKEWNDTSSEEPMAVWRSSRPVDHDLPAEEPQGPPAWLGYGMLLLCIAMAAGLIIGIVHLWTVAS